MHGSALKSTITGVPGWETEDEQALLVTLAVGVPESGVILEIGAEFGMSASLFAYGAKSSVSIFSIDTYPGSLLVQHRDNLREAGFGDRTIQLQGDSRVLYQDWKGGIDLLFVDGDHSFLGALADLKNWTGFIKPGGRLAIHDCANKENLNPHWMHFDVTRALSVWFLEQGGRWHFHQVANSLMVFERSKDMP